MMNKISNQQGSILPILILIIVAGLGAFGYLYLGQQSSQKPITPVKNQVKELVPSQSSDTKTSTSPTSAALISITKDGFIPSTITVAKGQQVTFINEDDDSHLLISDPKTPLEGFDSEEELKTNESFSFIFEKEGTFTYRDRTGSDPAKYKGEIIVK